jgi:hypothetical protein
VFINKLLKGLTALVAVSIIVSCNKEPDLIGLDLLPEGDRLNMSFTDTSTIIAYTVREDSLRTDELSNNLLGYLNDPIFGNVQASVYSQYRLSGNNITFGENPVADSIVFTLVYNGIYGDSLTQQTVRVYELNDSINIDSAYFSHSTVPILPEQIGEATFVPNLTEADSVDGAYVKPHLRITLTPEFANKLITSSTETLSSNSYFLDVFKGLYITTDPVAAGNPGSIIYFDMLDELSRITLHYHNTKDTSSVKFLINSSCARFNNYNHFGFSSASPELLQQFAGDTTAGNNRVFIQAMAGSKVKLRMPYLKDIPKNAKIAVNEALLILTNNEPESIFAPSALLGIRALSDSATYLVLPDETIGSAYLGGRYINNKEYRFRITKYVQDRMRYPDAKDNGLMLVTSGGSLSANRLILNGPAHPTDRMKLVIYYTIIE